MVQALQDKVQAQERKIEEQNGVLHEAGLAEENSGLSALSSFLETTDFYGSVAASYTQDLTFQGDNDGSIRGAFPNDTYNTFSLDQLWFGMDKAPTEESRGGFHADIAYGTNTFQSGAPSDLQLWSAYASYLAPVGNGIQIDAGDLWTLIGAEVVDTTGNFNITRGAQWGLQPVSHVGVIASTEVVDGVGFAIGAVNDPFSDNNKNVDTNKAVTGQINYSGDSFYIGVSGIYGSQNGMGEGDKYGMIDVLLTADPSENFSMWFNYDYNWYEDTPGAFFGGKNTGNDSSAHAFGAAGRLAITDDTGFAVRGELILYDLDNTVQWAGGRSDDPMQWSVTGTLDHALTDNVTARLEGRYDGSDERIFKNQNGNKKVHQAIAIAQLIYSF
ncbi:MAG: outer membrane beta-barrel protein [Myxococcota bacterium]